MTNFSLEVLNPLVLSIHAGVYCMGVEFPNCSEAAYKIFL